MSLSAPSGTDLSLQQITKPTSYIIRMVVFLAAVIAGVALIYLNLLEAFLANAALNGLILGVLILGVLYNLRMVWSLNREVGWIEGFRRQHQQISRVSLVQPKLLAPMANMLSEKSKDRRLTLSATATRSLLDSISSRLDEARELSRYLVGLLIFLGLLGTFWGLLHTVGSVGAVIGDINTASGSNIELWFEDLKDGLASPLDGMATAFSSSLFGLAGSLILGFLDLSAGQAQNRFFNDLEEWLSRLTRLGSGGGLADGEQSVPAYLSALIEQIAENMEQLQNSLSRGEASQAQSTRAVLELADRLSLLTDQMKAEQALMIKIGENQLQLKPILENLSDSLRGPDSGGLDEASRSHLRSLDTQLVRIAEELTIGRQQSVSEIRNEIKLLSRTIAAIAGES